MGSKTPICKAPSCGKPFKKYRTTQQTCSNATCALELVRHKAEKKKQKEWSMEKREFYMRDRSWMAKRAQKACNEYVRLRDKDLPCVSCGIDYGQMHAGHFKSVGHSGASLRYHWANIHCQCAQCNNYKSGNIKEYRPELINRIGLGMVEYLEQDHPPQKLTLEDLDDIFHWFKLQTCILRQKNIPPYLRNWLTETPQ